MSESAFYITSSPHVFDGDSTSKIMWRVVAALLPASVWAVVGFGISAAWVLAFSVASCMLFEVAAVKLRNRPHTLADGSAVVTGLLLGLNLPATSPWWIVVFGSGVAMLLGKHVFGGLGQNPFNPALVARVFLLIAFPVQMTDWSVPGGLIADAATGATPLGAAKTALSMEGGVLPTEDLFSLFVGMHAGSIGEVSVVALLAGGLYLLFTRTITLDIPLGFIATFALIVGAVKSHDPSSTISLAAHMTTGSLMMGALFMATDMVTSPLNSKGRFFYGVGCGLLTAVIRLWGAYPEGVSFAILIMNSCVPLIDRWTKPRKFGSMKQASGGSG